MKTEVTSRVGQENQSVRVTVLITEAEPRPTYGGTRAPLWRPASMFIRWNRYRVMGGLWSNWVPSVKVSGPKIKKDGTDSQLQHISHPYHERGEWSEIITTTMPEVGP